jgi:hypothetical protein
MTDPTLATIGDLADFTGQTFASTDPRALRALASASGVVRRECRQFLSYVADDTVSLRGNWVRKLKLPEGPVTAVGAVYVDDQLVVERVWTGGRYLRLLTEDEQRRGYGVRNGYGYRYWGGPNYEVRVTYSHGFAVIPAELVDVTLSLAARRLDNPLQDSIVEVEGYKRAKAGSGLTEDEMRVCKAYRVGA